MAKSKNAEKQSSNNASTNNSTGDKAKQSLKSMGDAFSILYQQYWVWEMIFFAAKFSYINVIMTQK